MKTKEPRIIEYKRGDKTITYVQRPRKKPAEKRRIKELIERRSQLLLGNGKYVRNPKVTVADLKLEAFLQEFMRNGGNAAAAAFVVGKPESMASAAVIGNRYLKQAKQLTAMYLERKGFGYGKMLDIAAEKMLDDKTPAWWDRLMKMTGYEDFFNKKEPATSATINVFNIQKKMRGEYGFEDNAEEIIDGEDKS